MTGIVFSVFSLPFKSIYMAKGIHKGTEYNNVQETWNQNQRNSAGSEVPASSPSTGRTDLDRVIEEESIEYDATNKEDQLLSGDRASVNDDE